MYSFGLMILQFEVIGKILFLKNVILQSLYRVINPIIFVTE